MNHIDVNKLKAAITQQIGLCEELKTPGKGDVFYTAEIDAFETVNKIIERLQQEQPERLYFTSLNRLIQKIPSEKWDDTVNNYAKKLRDCLIKEGYLKDAKVLQSYISYMNGHNVPMATLDEQEQSETPTCELDKLVEGAK